MSIDRHIKRRFRAGEDLSYPIICRRGGRPRLAEIFNELGFKEGVEIGTRKGDFSLVLCRAIPGLKLTCVDPWVAFRRVSQGRQDEYLRVAKEVLGPFQVNIMRMTSMEAVHSFSDRSLDFVFIDGSHDFDDVMMDLIFWSRKVKTNGIVAAHDYSMFPDVVRAVHAYIESHKIFRWYIAREYESTAFWVNP